MTIPEKDVVFFIPHVVLFLKSIAKYYITFGDTYKIFITHIGLDDNNITSDSERPLTYKF